MKVFLVLWVCVQSYTGDIEQACIQDVMPDTFDTIPQCLTTLKGIGEKMSELPNVYITGFCSSKYSNEA